uniref:WD_REPEATS_REGION domain-containing protein n=1 Tax=Syphacia muris TaxID=451379 RepID=A0A0N5A7X1_9BILA
MRLILVYKNANGKHFLLSGSRDQTVRIWKFNCASPLQTFVGHEMAIMGVAALDDITCVSGSRDTTLKTWDINSAKNTRTVERSRNVVTHLVFNKVRNILVQTSEDKQLKIWDPRELQLIHEFPPKFQILKHCDVSPDGNYCITSSSGTNGNGCEVTLYDIRQQRMVREFKGHEESVSCAVFLPQQLIQKTLILSISVDGAIKIWDLERGGCLSNQMVPVNVELLSCVAFGDGNVVISGGNASLFHYSLSAPGARPFLQCISYQTRMIHSNNQFRIGN